MEPSETKEAEQEATAKSEVLPPVGPGRIFTGPDGPAITGVVGLSKEKDGSVISAVTDPASLEGPPLHAMNGEESLQPDLGVPKQVILPEAEGESDQSDSGGGGCLSPAPPRGKASPTTEGTAATNVDSPSSGSESSSLEPPPAPASDSEASPPKTVAESGSPRAHPASRTVLSEPPPATDPDSPPGKTRSTSSADETEVRANTHEKESTSENSVDEYIRSPEVQNAIVERSPGGRYVRFMEKLGSGASKDVYRAYDTQEGIEVAWNVVNLSGVPKAERNRIVNEVRLLERLHHHNIISFHGSWVNRERQEVNFVTEILSSGTLKSFIKKVQVIRWKIAKRWAVQILKGLEYLHSQEPPVIHRDLKCENIFINGTSGDLRIGDLGLSTVHRNGRVLSVLGTPEFMAPDMYEENSYDESVDVYAFGMCMLEIFTKEIPYSECSNPAQIYKKVSAGEPPDVLTRLQSKHAREFIQYCLGYKDETGRYIRPTVSELLQHPFLVKRGNDDDEVVVQPPLRERAIAEGPSESSSASPAPKRVILPEQSSQSPVESQSERKPSAVQSTPPPVRRKPSYASSQDEDDADKFEEMQESEITMRKVKVLMGRGQELKEEEEGQKQEQDSVRGGDGASVLSSDRGSDHGLPAAAVPPPPPPPPPSNGQVMQQTAITPQAAVPTPQQQTPSVMHYLVAAAVLEHENPNIRPYADDILKLVVTLPVDGQTQNVQFDFHLVEDDPVQVAKEMVQELGIPQGAVLEISETISGLARTARMKQDKYAGRMQNLQGHIQPQYQPGIHPPHGVQHQGHHVQQQQGVAPQDPSQYQQHGVQGANFSGHSQHGSIMSGSSQDITQYMQQPGPPPPTQHQTLQDASQYQPQGLPSAPHHVQQPQDQAPYQQQGAQQGLHMQQQGVVQHQGMPQTAQQSQPIHHQGTVPNGMPHQAGVQHVQQQGVVPSGGQQEQYQQDYYQQQIQPGSVRQHQVAQVGAGGQDVSQMRQVRRPSPVPSSDGTSIPPPMPQVSQQEVSQDQSRQIQGQQVPQQVYVQPAAATYGLPPAGSETPVPQQQLHVQGAIHPHQQQMYASQPLSSASPPPPQGLPVAGPEGMTAQLQSQTAAMQPQTQEIMRQPHAVIMPVQETSQTVPVGAPGPGQYQADVVTQSVQQKLPFQDHVNPPTNGTSQTQLPEQMPESQHVLENGVTGSQHVSVNSMNIPGDQLPTTSSSGPKSKEGVVSSGSLADSQRGSMSSTNTSDDVDSDEDEELSEQLRALNEDFQKNLQRTKKVFDNRMDNLQRSQFEREAQHQKTLERHEKERAEFEKRLAQEEEEQNRRIEQLKRDFHRKREKVAKKRKNEPGADG